MQQMLEVCEDYAMRFNISFSTDPNPTKSKSKCIFMIGERRNLLRPVPLTLGGRELPWVSTAVNLGYELHSVGNRVKHEHRLYVHKFVFHSL